MDTKTILLVEDEDAYALTEIHWLRKDGYDVIRSPNGEKAIEAAKDPKNKIDLILMDIDLGAGIDGTIAAQEILKEHDIPILFLSSHTAKDYVDRTEKITSYGYVVKDSKEIVLLASIRMAFRLQEANKNILIKQNELIESERNYFGILNSITESIYVQDQHGIFIDVNEGAVEMYGYSKEEFIGKTPEFVSAPGKNDLSKIGEYVKNTFETGKTQVFEFWGRRKSGEIFPKEVILNKGKYFGLDVIIATARDISQHKTVEQFLKNESVRNKILFTAASDAIYILDTGGNILEVNNSFCTMLGYSNDEARRMNVLQLDAHFSPEELKSKIRTPHNFVKLINTKLKCKDGKLLEVEISAIGTELDGKHVWIASARDITERKRTERKLTESEMRYRELVENAPIPIVVHQNGKIIIANKQTAHLFGTKEETDLLGTAWIEHIHPDSMNIVKNRIKVLIEEGKKLPVVEQKLLRIDGSVIEAEVTSAAIPLNGNPAVQLAIRDISDRKRVEKRIQQHIIEITNLYDTTKDLSGVQKNLNELLDMLVKRAVRLLNRTDGGMYLFDRATNDLVVAASTNPLKPVGTRVKLGEGMAGRVAMDRQPMIIDDYCSWPNRLPIYNGTELTSVIEVPMLYQGELIGVIVVEEFGENAPRFTENDLRLLTIFAGQAAGAVHASRLLSDLQKINKELEQIIFERKQIEVQLQKYADQLKALNDTKNKFFSIIAHDLRSPLQGVLGLFEILKTDFNTLSTEEAKHYIDIVENSLQKQYELLSDLLEWARLQTESVVTEFETFPLQLEVKKITDPLLILAIEKNIRLINNVDEKIELYADKNLIGIVIRNLVSNGIKFTHSGGLVSISAMIKNNHAEITVSDTGVGIPKESLEKLFRIDIRNSTDGTLKEKGTGLGLILCKEIIEKLGGNIQIESRIDKGTKVIFLVPYLH